MKQLKVGLTDDVRAELDRAAEARGWSTSEEARMRLETSLNLDVYDAATQRFGEHMLGLADTISRFPTTGARAVPGWHKDPALFEALKVAATKWLELISLTEGQGASVDVDGDKVDPTTLGKAVAQNQFRRLQEKMLFDQEKEELEHTLRGKPMFHYDGYYGKGTVNFGDLDKSKPSKRERNAIEKEVLIQREQESKRQTAFIRKSRLNTKKQEGDE